MIYFYLWLAEAVKTIDSIVIIILAIAATLGSIVGIGAIINYFYNYEEDVEKCLKILKPTLVITTITSIFLIILPSPQVMYEWAAVFLGKKAVETTQLDEKIKKVSHIVDLKLDTIIKEIENESKRQN